MEEWRRESRKGRPPVKSILASQLPQWGLEAYFHWETGSQHRACISELSYLQGRAAGVFIRQLPQSDALFTLLKQTQETNANYRSMSKNHVCIRNKSHGEHERGNN